MTNHKSTSLAVRSAVAKEWSVPKSSVFVFDARDDFPLFGRHLVYLASDAPNHTVPVLVRGAEIQVFGQLDRCESLGAALSVEELIPPATDDLLELSQTVRDFLVGVGGRVVTSKFALDVLSKSRPNEPGDETAAWLFVDPLLDPVLSTSDGGEWSLAFLFWTRSGSIERWSVVGSDHGILSTCMNIVAPSGTFNLPVG